MIIPYITMSERSETESERDLDNIEVVVDNDEDDNDDDDDNDDCRLSVNQMQDPAKDHPSGVELEVWWTGQALLLYHTRYNFHNQLNIIISKLDALFQSLSGKFLTV